MRLADYLKTVCPMSALAVFGRSAPRSSPAGEGLTLQRRLVPTRRRFPQIAADRIGRVDYLNDLLFADGTTYRIQSVKRRCDLHPTASAHRHNQLIATGSEPHFR